MSSLRLDQQTPLPAPTAMEEAALAWFAQCQRGLSDEQEIQFQEWLSADPQHATLFNELHGTWSLLGRVQDESKIPANPAPRSRWRARMIRFGRPLAAAATFAVAYLAWWRPTHFTGEIATEVGALRVLTLPDGSLVTLNTDSEVSAAFTPSERRIRLERGEAHFVVAKNPRRPFIVEAGGVSVRAVGTAFNVRFNAKAVEVLVTEGKVRVDDAASGKSLLARPDGVDSGSLGALGDPVLTSGHKVLVALPAPVTPVETVLQVTAGRPVSADEMQRELAWQDRRLEFDLATLDEIAAEFNRYSRHKLVIADEALGQRRFGGSFRPDDQAGFVRMLQENFGVVAQETEAATVLRAGP
jgi:transmembrane sensor